MLTYGVAKYTTASVRIVAPSDTAILTAPLANAEYLARLRKVMDDAGVTYQFAELGKVDVGGGGTIAYIMANYGMEVIDSGVAVLSMHAPYEVSSKADVYEAVKGYRAFLLNM